MTLAQTGHTAIVRIFSMIVYNGFKPRNIKMMEYHLHTAFYALIAMAED
jgi:hypothetical protein